MKKECAITNKCKGKNTEKMKKIFDPIVTCNLSAGGDMAYFLLLSLKLKLVLR